MFTTATWVLVADWSSRWSALQENFSSSAELVFLLIVGLLFLWELMGLRYIPNNYVGIVEKLWSRNGSVTEGSIIAMADEAGFQAEVLRGGFHFGLWRWQYRIHRVRLVTIPQGKIGYIYARDGEPLEASQTLGRVVECMNFQDARAFLGGDDAVGHRRGQRGRQRAVLREGVYAINLALFVVMTENDVYLLRPLHDKQALAMLAGWQRELAAIAGFSPVVIGADVEVPDPVHADVLRSVDSIGIVTVHDGPSLLPGEIIAPPVGTSAEEPHFHNNYQNTEAFLAAGGRRGRQYVPLTDGTYFINRWFATVETIAKTVVPIGYVGVVVSYFGQIGRDLSGTAFRHGERVAEGHRGVWEHALGPGKYAFNSYAGSIVLVPTTNFVLHWITGRTETHRYDESLRSIDLVTKDAYEPLLPLSVVVHIDYQKAPNVIQRFGDVKKLITQTLDPMLSAYFRDVAHKCTMLQLLQERDQIQRDARNELRQRFQEFDIECVDVLIGKPDTAEAGGKIETLLEQLRLRQLSIEQIETFERQRAAAEKQRGLSEAQAHAAKQTELTNSAIQIQIAENQGEADLAQARKRAEQLLVTARADSQQRVLAGKGEGARVLQTGLAEASVLLRKIGSFGDPRLYAVLSAAERLSASSQPLVPERVFVAGGGENGHATGASQGLLGTLISLLVAEKSGFQPAGDGAFAGLEEMTERMTRDAMESMQQAIGVGSPAVAVTTAVDAKVIEQK
ncbi:MAG: SPFH domain-containing protein [Pirellulales bacterium]